MLLGQKVQKQGSRLGHKINSTSLKLGHKIMKHGLKSHHNYEEESKAREREEKKQNHSYLERSV